MSDVAAAGNCEFLITQSGRRCIPEVCECCTPLKLVCKLRGASGGQINDLAGVLAKFACVQHRAFKLQSVE